MPWCRSPSSWWWRTSHLSSVNSKVMIISNSHVGKLSIGLRLTSTPWHVVFNMDSDISLKLLPLSNSAIALTIDTVTHGYINWPTGLSLSSESVTSMSVVALSLQEEMLWLPNPRLMPPPSPVHYIRVLREVDWDRGRVASVAGYWCPRWPLLTSWDWWFNSVAATVLQLATTWPMTSLATDGAGEIQMRRGTKVLFCQALGPRPAQAQELFTVVLCFFGTTSRCLSVQPFRLLPSRNIWRHISSTWSFLHRHRHTWLPVGVTELFLQFCC